MGILGGGGFTLPVVSEVEVVDVSIDMTDAARSALSASMGGDEDTHVLLISAQSGGCSGYMYDMAIVEAPETSGFQIIEIDKIRVFIHNKDSVMLNGIRVDYKTPNGGRLSDREPECLQILWMRTIIQLIT